MQGGSLGISENRVLDRLNPTPQQRRDFDHAAHLRRLAREFNLAALAAGEDGLIVRVEVRPQDLDDDSDTETGNVDGIEVMIDRT